MTEEGKYIYCIVKKSKNQRFNFVGINNREVALLHYKDIAAVVSSSPIINFDRLDKEELTRYVTCHQKINEEVMKEYDVVPMAFGIIAPSVDEVSRILEKAYLQFKTALREVKGKAEFAVQVRWDKNTLVQELANANPEIQRLKQKIANKTGILGMSSKLRLGKLLCQETEVFRKICIKDIQTVLASLAPDSSLNKLIDEDMIANFSFLIERVREPGFDKKMNELGEKYQGRLRFKYIGPMPPYSFVNINLSLGNFEIVNEARKLLGLEEEATLNEIQKVYHTLAHQYHPDKGGDKKKMKEINQAYTILKSYCQSSAELAGKDFDPNQKYSFKKEDVENSLIIK
ncbi:GvpL/GvpF family gas vesicle protein [Patescibacteria group bacterium]|nr:GvpL/GvpF family gas vesicle protein [Patescibacteria group bacterium]